MSEWQPIETLDHDNEVMLAKWYEDDCDGYYGESRWIWIASGCLGLDGTIWIDFTDENHQAEFHHKPTHWMPSPLPPPPNPHSEKVS